MKGIITGIFVAGLVWVSYAYAQSQGQGPNFVTHADVTATSCTSGSTQALPQSTPVSSSSSLPNRKCAFITNSGGTNPARCGDANVSATQGTYLAITGGAMVACVSSAINCCGVGGSTTINPSESVNQ